MVGLVPAIHVLGCKGKAWMPGASSAKTRLALLPGHDDERSGPPSLHRRLQTRLRRTRPQRPWLALMRRPAGQPDNVEGGVDAAVRIGETAGVDLGHPDQGGG